MSTLCINFLRIEMALFAVESVNLWTRDSTGNSEITKGKKEI
jgi:hypothetical protein